jgi:hypothetical protein
MDPLLAAVLASSVVAAVVAGAFGYLNGGRIEKLKAQLLANQERTKRLGDAHIELLGIKTSGTFDIHAAKKDPNAALTALVIEMTAEFNKAEDVYVKIRPLLKQKHKDDVDVLHRNAVEINERAAKRLHSEEVFDQTPTLKALLSARSEFIESLKSNVENAYKESAEG